MCELEVGQHLLFIYTSTLVVGAPLVDSQAQVISLTHNIPVFTYVEGGAPQRDYLSCVGAKRFVTEHSFMLIHQISTGVWGTYENLNDEKESMDSLMEMISSIYLKHTT